MHRCVRHLTAFVLVVATLVSGCASESADGAPDGEIVASVFPLFDAASFVGGSRLHITNLLPLDPFGALPPEKAQVLRSATLAIILGGGTQPGVEQIAAERTGPTVRILDQMTTKVHPVRSGTDPHVWLDPKGMAEVVTLVENSLRAVDPGGVSLFTKNAERTRNSLAVYDRRLAATFATCARRDVVTTRGDYQYLTDAYGLHQIVVSTPEALRDAVADVRPTTVYADDLPTIAAANRLQNGLGVRVSTLDPLTTLTDQARRGGASYWSVMDINVAALQNGLACKKQRR